MKHTVWIMALAAMFAATAALGGEPGKGEEPPTVEQMEFHERALELKAREAELEHEQKLRELEIKEREAEIARNGDDMAGKKEGGGALLLIFLIVNILLTVWVFKDMKEQEIGRALWVPIVLLTGIFGAILYAIIRNADLRAKATGAGAAAAKAGRRSS